MCNTKLKLSDSNSKIELKRCTDRGEVGSLDQNWNEKSVGGGGLNRGHKYVKKSYFKVS